MRLLVALVLGLLLYGGCSGSSPRLIRPMGEASAALRLAGLTPLVGQRFRLGEDGVLAGFVPGQHPEHRNTLVVVGAASGTASGEALLDAAQVLVAQVASTQTPDRTVLVALWPSAASAPASLAAVLSAPIWPRDRLASVLVVGGDDGAELAASARGVPLRVVTAPSGGEALAPAIVQAVREAARAPADSTNTSQGR